MQWTIVIYIFHLLLYYTYARDSSVSGNYVLNWCQRANRSDDLHRLLGQFRQAMQLVLSDVKLGTSSPHGFRTYFKSNTNLAITNQVFRAIVDGQNLTRTGKRPVVECASPEALTGSELENYRKFCEPPGKVNDAAAVPSMGTIVLCPRFWDHPTFPGEEDCPAVIGRRGRKKFLDGGESLRETRFLILVHELMHLYNPQDFASGKPELYSVQECADLDKEESVANAENWAVYAACKLHPSSPFYAGSPSASSSSWDISVSSDLILCTEN